jgi:FdrA protein
VVAIVIGTAEDPQDVESQVERLTAAGASVVFNVDDAVRFAETFATQDEPTAPMLRPKRVFEPERPAPTAPDALEPVPAEAFASPMAAINLGLESFHSSLVAQGAAAVHVDWRPPAGGNERLMTILDRLRATRAAEASR